MAVRFNAAADRLLRTTNTPSTSADWTITFWFYISTDTNAFATFLYIGSNNYGATDWCYLGTDSDGTTVLLDIKSVSDNGTNLSTSTWYHGAVTRNNSGTTQFFLNGVLDASVNDTNGGVDRESVVEIIRIAEIEADHTVLNIHWGNEYRTV